jgi:transposase-like protein
MTQGRKNVSIEIEISKLFELLDVQPDLRSALQVMLQALIEAELSQEIGAGKYERNGNRKNLRNGYRRRKKPLQTGLGPLEISIPKLRWGSFYPTILERYQRVDRALMGVIQEAYIQGVSTRSMQKVFQRLGLTDLDKSTVSRLVQPVREAVERWRQRPLEARYLYVWLDALYVKLRREGLVQSVAVLVAIGVREDGRREVFGFQVGNNESYVNWKEFLQHLKGRGLVRAGLWISDDHAPTGVGGGRRGGNVSRGNYTNGVSFIGSGTPSVR